MACEDMEAAKHDGTHGGSEIGWDKWPFYPNSLVLTIVMLDASSEWRKWWSHCILFIHLLSFRGEFLSRPNWGSRCTESPGNFLSQPVSLLGHVYSYKLLILAAMSLAKQFPLIISPGEQVCDRSPIMDNEAMWQCRGTAVSAKGKKQWLQYLLGDVQHNGLRAIKSIVATGRSHCQSSDGCRDQREAGRSLRRYVSTFRQQYDATLTKRNISIYVKMGDVEAAPVMDSVIALSPPEYKHCCSYCSFQPLSQKFNSSHSEKWCGI